MPQLYAQRRICHVCQNKQEKLKKFNCNGTFKCGSYCEECQLDLQPLQKCWCDKAAVFELLRKRMVGVPGNVYREKDIICIRSYV